MVKELYIVNYCNPNCTPLNSITRLTEEEAYKKAKELSDRYNGTSFGRFTDFINYYPKRIQTEKWLYHCFTKLGGKPETKHPLYFVLQGSDFLDKWFEKGRVTKLLLENINSEHISFTFGDSMAKFNKPEQKEPFLKETLYEYIKKFNGDINLFLDSIKEQYTYIEVQLWSDLYCSELMQTSASMY